MFCFVSCYFFFFSNIKISHENKVYFNIKMNLTSTVNIRFTVSVAIGLYCLCTNVEFLAKCLSNLLQFFCDRQMFDFFSVVSHTLHLLIPQFLWKPKRCSTESWFGNIGLNSGKVSLKVMLFILTSKCSHIIYNWEIRGHKENTDGIRWCSGIKRKHRENCIQYILQETGSREQVNIT